MSENFLIYNLILSRNPAENEEILEENVNMDMIEVLWCAEEWPKLRTDEKFMKNLMEPEKSYGIKYDVPPEEGRVFR